MSSPFARTPESLTTGLRRKDSKNALTTCHGVTSSGRACRRPLANAKAAIGAKDFAISGAFVIPSRSNGDPAVFFCHQHRDQAELLLRRDDDEVVDIEDPSIDGRRSLETVFRELRLEEVEEESSEDEDSDIKSSPPRTPVVTRRPVVQQRRSELREVKPKRPQASPQRRSKPHTTQRRSNDNVQAPSPLVVAYHKSRAQPNPFKGQPPRRNSPKKESFWSKFFDCFRGDGLTADDYRQSTNRVRPAEARASMTELKAAQAKYPMFQPPGTQIRIRQGDQRKSHRVSAPVPTGLRQREEPRTPTRQREKKVRDDNRQKIVQPSQTPPRTPNKPRQEKRSSKRDSPTSSSLSSPADWHPTLPPNPSDQTRLLYARLLTTMSEPPTKSDAAGYIYIFWQTEEKQSTAETSAALSVIDSDISSARSGELWDHEEVLQQHKRKTLALKIGRAANVHQRLGQWRKQCQYDITLLRSYPYDPSARRRGSSPRTPDGPGGKVAFVGKVEKLIHLHLEMLGLRVPKACRCGTVHREWFEVEASVVGIREVDAVVRNWVKWSEGKFGEGI